jgi:hypothetical protein
MVADFNSHRPPSLFSEFWGKSLVKILSVFNWIFVAHNNFEDFFGSLFWGNSSLESEYRPYSGKVLMACLAGASLRAI